MGRHFICQSFHCRFGISDRQDKLL
jgi:hypothetical protein